MKKFVITIQAVVIQHRYVNAESIEDAAAIFNGESEVFLDEAEYDFSDETIEEQILSITEIKEKP